MSDTDRQKPKRYVDVDVLRDVDGVTAVISQQRIRPDEDLDKNKHFAVGYFKEFTREDGRKERTAFIKLYQHQALLRLMTLADKRIDELVQIERDRREDNAAAGGAR